MSQLIHRNTACKLFIFSIIIATSLVVGCEEQSSPPSPEDSSSDLSGGDAQGGQPEGPLGGRGGEERPMSAPHSAGAGALSGQEEGSGGAAVGGELMDSEAGQSVIPVPPPEEEEVSCLRSCVDFVECALSSCEGYDDDDTSLLMTECLALCIDPIARAFDRLKSCEDKLRFAFTVRPDFSEFCASVSEGFCETYLATCGEWLGEGPCEPHYNEAPDSGPDLTSGAHRACYEYHLGSAMRALEQGDDAGVREGCERAAGRAICVDPSP